MSLIDLQKKVVKEEKKYFENPLKYARMIKHIAEKLLDDPDIKVIVFGSAAKGEAIPGKSDIDVLLVSRKAPMSPREQAELRVKILAELGDLLAPFEIHIVTPEIYDKWYKKHIDKAVNV